MVKCLECQLEFEDDVKLHRHLRSHKIKIEQYYVKHFPRFDLYDSLPIKFTTKSHYFNTDFNTRYNFLQWFKSSKEETLIAYSRKFLQDRKLRKSLIFAPTQVELRSLDCPSILGYDKLFGDYYKLCYELGYRVKYIRPDRDDMFGMSRILENGTVLIDTREQLPLSFNIPSRIATLNVGDYAFEDPSSEKEIDIVIERKSLKDFISSFGRDYERVRKEFQRATLSGKRVLVITEMDLKHVLVFGSSPEFHGKVNPDFVFHNVRNAIQEFPNIQFLFSKNRLESVRVIEQVFASKGALFQYDLQLAYDLGQL